MSRILRIDSCLCYVLHLATTTCCYNDGCVAFGLAATKFTTNGIATHEVAIAVCVAYVSVQVPSSHAAVQQQAKARQVRIRVPGHDEDLFPGGLWPDCVAHLLPVGADHGRRNKLRQQSGSPPQRKKLRSSLPPTRPPPRRSKGALDT